MRDFEVKRNPDDSWALMTVPDGDHIDGVLIRDTGQDPVQVWATARTDKSGQLFYVRIPVTRAMLNRDPQTVEGRLRVFAEQWEGAHPEL